MTGSTTESADPAEPPALGAAPAPGTSRRSRVRRRREQRRRRRIRYLGASAVVAVVGLVVTLVAGSGRGGDERPQVPAPSAAKAAVVQPVLLAQQDATGRATSLTVMAPAEGGRGGSLLLIPPGTMTEVVSLGLEPVARSLELGGPDRLRATVENLLGSGLATVAVVDDATLAAMLEPLGPLTVQVPERVEQVVGGGRVEVLFEQGQATVQPSDAPRFLGAKGRSSDLARLARHQAFWDAWLAALRQRPDAAPAQPPALAAAFDALAAGTVRTRVVPVEAFGTAAAEGELYKVREVELARLVSTVFPAAGRVAGARPRVQILNGTGAVGLADAVRNRIGAAFDVRLTGNAGSFDRERTEIVFYDRGEQAVAERVRTALGVGTLVFSRRPLDVVDVTIVVGKDFGTE